MHRTELADGPPHVWAHAASLTLQWAPDGELLLQVPKPERKAKAAEILRDVKPSRGDLYLPVNAHARVLDVIATSATPMQSAAKVPPAHTCGGCGSRLPWILFAQTQPLTACCCCHDFLSYETPPRTA